MDGNNFYSNDNNAGQNNGGVQPGGQNNNYYQDNTAGVNYYQPPVNDGKENKTNGLQIAGLVCGILGICSSCCYGVPGLIFGIIGLICSLLGNKRSKSGVGVAGLICSIIGLIFGVAMTIYVVYIFKIVFEGMESGAMDINDPQSITDYIMQKFYNY